MTHMLHRTVLIVTALLVAGTSLGGAWAATGAPPSYTTAQAAAGHTLFEQNCSRCHGVNLEGVSGPPLRGTDFTSPGAQGHLTVSDIFKYMSNLMPAGNPGSLTHAQYLAIMAFIMQQNGMPSGKAPLTLAVARRSKAAIGAK
ncbi:MAG: c-type cytochrome [Vulcanimicrobiaceae bacterium]